MDSIKLKLIPRFKTKENGRYLFILLITTCPSNGSNFLEKKARLKNIQQLTFSGENAEGYFSLNGSMLIYQSHDGDSLCDQIYTMDLSTRETKLVSTGLGVTTCAYFEHPKCENIIYASTHLGGRACPPKPDYSRGYVWKLYSDYDIFKSTRDGKTLEQMTNSPGYDAEATVVFNGSKVLYTSISSRDLEV